MGKSKKTIKTLEDYDFELVLTANGFKAKQHFMKLIVILRTIYEKKQVSKWDLATVDKKKGLVPYSWVLVHKLILELEELGLIRSKGIRKITDKEKKEGKKHDVSAFELTDRGFAFLMLIDHEVFESHSLKIWKNKMGKNSVHILINYVWEAGLYDSYNIPLRMEILESLLVSNVEKKTETIILEAMMEDVLRITKNVIQKMRNTKPPYSKYVFSRFLYLLNLGMAMSRIQFDDKNLSDMIVEYLTWTIFILEIQVSVLKQVWSSITLYRWPEDKPMLEMKQVVIEKFSELSSAMERNAFIKKHDDFFKDLSKSISPAIESIKRLTKSDGITSPILDDESNERMVTFVHSFMDDLQAAVNKKDMVLFLKHFSEKVHVNISQGFELYQDRSGKGTKLIEDWIKELPTKSIVIDNHIEGKEIHVDLKLISKNRILITRIMVTVNMHNEIVKFLVNFEKTRDLKHEREILEVKSDPSNPYSKTIMGLYRSLLKGTISEI